jgi:hypothetical protein
MVRCHDLAEKPMLVTATLRPSLGIDPPHRYLRRNAAIYDFTAG